MSFKSLQNKSLSWFASGKTFFYLQYIFCLNAFRIFKALIKNTLPSDRFEHHQQKIKISKAYSQADILPGVPTINPDSARELTPDQPDYLLDSCSITLPVGTFLGDIPCRYSSEYSAYRSQGGLFEADQNSISYAFGDKVRFYTLSMIFDLIKKENLSGDMAELGVYKGDTAQLIVNFARKLSRNVYLLDTFDGFDDRDLGSSEIHLSGHFSETSLDYVRARIGAENAIYVAGFFPDTSSELPQGGMYCLVHIDADLYAPIKAGLEYFYPRMVNGGFIVIHDYMSLCWQGAIQAVDEFFADKPEFIIPIPDLAGSVIIRKCQASLCYK